MDSKKVPKYVISKRKKNEASDAEVKKIFEDFYRKSSAIIRKAIKESHERHPELFRSSKI